MIKLPPFIKREIIHSRLPLIFPEGTVNRNDLVREIAASTIFTMLYVGAVEGNQIYVGPVHIYRMTKEQAELTDDLSRSSYHKGFLKKNFMPFGERWYADNTREPIRDETIKDGLMVVGAVISLKNLPTTSNKPRYALQKSFSELFDPNDSEEILHSKIQAWQNANLTASARMRISLAHRSSTDDSNRVLVTFPNKESKHLSPGPSSLISKAVVEVFCENFLKNPAVLWLSTSDKKVPFLDKEIADLIGLNIEQDKILPDIILVDLGASEPLLVFVEVVATDGAVTEERQKALYKLTDKAGIKMENVSFLTAFSDRQSKGFKKTVSKISWKSFVWFLSEPENLLILKNGKAYLTDLIG